MQRAAANGSSFDHELLVVAHAELVVREEHLSDEVAAAAHAGLLEDVLEVLLDRVCDRDQTFRRTPGHVHPHQEESYEVCTSSSTREGCTPPTPAQGPALDDLPLDALHRART